MITMMFTGSPENTVEGKRIFESHAKWMEGSHHRDGELEMLSYNIASGPEYSIPLDPSSEPTGNITYTLCEVYRNPEGLADHWKQAEENWEDFSAMMDYIGKIKLTIMHGAPIEHSLW